MNQNFEKLKPFIQKENMLTTMQNIIDWEMQTIMPSNDDKELMAMQETIANEYYTNLVNFAVEKYLDRCETDAKKERLSPTEAGIVKCLARKFSELKVVEQKDYVQLKSLETECMRMWNKAKEKKILSIVRLK